MYGSDERIQLYSQTSLLLSERLPVYMFCVSGLIQIYSLNTSKFGVQGKIPMPNPPPPQNLSQTNIKVFWTFEYMIKVVILSWASLIQLSIRNLELLTYALYIYIMVK